MQNGPRTIMDTRQRKSAASFVAQKRRGSNTLHDKPNGSQNAQRSYERYLGWPKLISWLAILSGRRTTTSTPNIFLGRCRRIQDRHR
jgi:murein endopeptidase